MSLPDIGGLRELIPQEMHQVIAENSMKGTVCWLNTLCLTWSSPF